MSVSSVHAAQPARLPIRAADPRWLVPLISILLLIPCFWHSRIQAGDLGSHVYNAWLANEAQAGRAPGIYVVPQFHNVAVDLMLAYTGRWFGYQAAEKIVVSLCVLVFFWAAFFFISVASQRRPWPLVPILAAMAYGYTFEMGFFNYYLALGLALASAAFAIRGQARNWAAAAVLAILTFVAHPVGLFLLVGIVLYWTLAELTSGWLRAALFVAALLAVWGVRLYLMQFRVMLFETRLFYFFNGADQIMLFGRRYMALFGILLLFALVSLIIGLVTQRRTPVVQRARTPLELWAVLLFAAAVLPEVIFLPYYAAPLALFVSRATLLSAVFLLCALSTLRPPLWQAGGFAACAAFFFVWLYADTGRLNRLETSAHVLLDPLPQGARIVGTLGPERGWRVLFLVHILDRACLGHCYTFYDYEPSSGQFRIRVRPGARLVTDSAQDSGDMQFGQWKVTAKDLPLKQIYQCSPNDFDRLCIRDLKAGEINCAGCNNPFYWFLHR